MAGKWILASRKNGQKMAGIWAHLSHFPGHSSPIFQVKPRSIFHFRPHFGPEARNVSVRGQKVHVRIDLPVPLTIRVQKRHIKLCHTKLCPVTPVTGLPGRVPGQRDLCSLGSDDST